MTSTAFITGAGRGIGRATALAFAREGASLLVTDICAPIPECPYPLATREQLEATAAKCRELGARVVSKVVDVRNAEEISSAVAEAEQSLGRIDVLVNNAGIVGPGGVPAHELSEAEWDVVIDVDLNGVWKCARAVVPGMIGHRGGSIVNISSTGGLVAFPHFANYVAAKHGVIGLTRGLALDYAPYGIRVNAVCPTSVRDDPALDSGMLTGVAEMLGLGLEDYEMLTLRPHPLGSRVAAAAVAAAGTWLASEAATRVTGAVIPVDAGFTAR